MKPNVCPSHQVDGEVPHYSLSLEEAHPPNLQHVQCSPQLLPQFPVIILGAVFYLLPLYVSVKEPVLRIQTTLL
jgi:hypothetical protein